MADELLKRGYRNVRVLIGGVENWKKSGFPLAAETAEQHAPEQHPSA